MREISSYAWKTKEDRSLGGRERNKTEVNCQQLSIKLIKVNVKL